MRFQNMSNTYSSQISSRYQNVLGSLIAERAGNEWCLFLDRDGVINRQIVGDYVRSWRQFQWLPNAATALKTLRDWAPHLVIVTNQQGIGKGLMSVQDVEGIHRKLRTELALEGVTIDAVQVCPHLEAANCHCRKPSPGMVLEWLRKNPENHASLSIVVGDSGRDMELARNVATARGGCASIQIGGADLGGIADASFESLWDFAVAVDNVRKEQGL
jgi:histidinol-phosphate phosphatase family protein